MGKFLAVIAAIILANISFPAEAALWGRIYIANNMYGHCGDYRLSPDIRIANCQKAVTSHWLQRGGELYELNDLSAALEDKSDYAGAALVLSKAVAISTHQQTPWEQYLLGLAYLHEGKPDLATADFKTAIAQTNDAYSYAGLGEVSAADGHYKDAIDFYNKAAALVPSDVSLLVGRAYIYARMGDYKKAMADDDAVIAEYRYESFPYNSRCWDRAILNRNIDDALADCTHALDLLPDDPNALDSRGLVRFRQQKWDEAIADYTAALSHNPYLACSIYMRGISELRKGATASGQADVDKAKAIDPKISAEYAMYGIVP